MARKIFFVSILSIVSLISIVFYQWQKFYDGRLHVVFCNVGQGDGIFIRTPKGLDIIVDGGPDDLILACLSNHMPFWDRDIELMLLTHPHADHMNGLLPVLKRYTVLSFATEKLENKTLGFQALIDSIKAKHLTIQYAFAGKKIKTPDSVVLSIVGPTQEFLTKTSPGGTIGESSEFGSLETLVSYGIFKILLTGDSQAEELQEAIDAGYLGGVDVLQVPHHGSKTGLTDEIFEAIRPGLAVISVGKNKYGHPTPQTLELLKSNGVKVLRTDQHGDIEIVSDEKKWFVKGRE